MQLVCYILLPTVPTEAGTERSDLSDVYDKLSYWSQRRTISNDKGDGKPYNIMLKNTSSESVFSKPHFFEGMAKALCLWCQW